MATGQMKSRLQGEAEGPELGLSMVGFLLVVLSTHSRGDFWLLLGFARFSCETHLPTGRSARCGFPPWARALEVGTWVGKVWGPADFEPTLKGPKPKQTSNFQLLSALLFPHFRDLFSWNWGAKNRGLGDFSAAPRRVGVHGCSGTARSEDVKLGAALGDWPLAPASAF